MDEMISCPFCGGEPKISFRYYQRRGKWYIGADTRNIKYLVQPICKQCHSRGKPIATDWMDNPNPWARPEEFEKYIKMAIEAWNKRVKVGKKK